MSNTKSTTLILLVLAGVLIAILAMSLPNLVLLPGQSFSLGESQSEALGLSATGPGGMLLYNIFRGVMAIMMILLPLYVVYSLFNKAGRKRLIVLIVFLILIFLVSDYIQTHPPEMDGETQPMVMGVPQAQEFSGDSIPTNVFSPDPPNWLTLMIVAAGSLIAGTGLSFLIWRIRRQAQVVPSPLEQLAEEARSAIVTIHAGADVRETIIHAYRDMSRVLKQERGLARDATMTPREFEYRLAGSGLPQESITALTRLFEQVRYGHTLAGVQEKNQALSCLTDIVNACKVITGGQD